MACRKIFIRHAIFLALRALVAIVLAPAFSHAGEVQISPTEVAISPSAPTELLSLTNQGDDTLRYELTTFAWAQTANGGMVLTKTEDIIAFPSLITLGPRQTKRIRFGAQVTFGDVEKTYRAILQELPSDKQAGGTPSIKFVARVSLPIFMRSAAARPEPHVGPPSLTGNVVSFPVLNSGTAHFMLRTIRAVGLDSGGRNVFEVSTQGWYVLAAGRRDYRLSLSEADCRRLGRLVLEAEIDAAPTRAEFPLTCASSGSAGKTEFLKSPEATQSGTP